MGERSNIFVRIRSKERSNDKNYKHETFFGLYYQWCYGERMISRLRSAINFVENHIGGWSGEWAVSEEQIRLFKKYLAINFDMQDIVEPLDLVPDAVDDVMQGYSTAKADIFDQAENHGFIYIDITLDDPEEKFGENKANIKYAFVDNEYHSKKYPLPPIRSVENFADHDIGDDERKWYEPNPYWEDKSWGPARKENFLKNIVPTTKKNIDEINKKASVMSEEERKDFVSFGRRFTRNILKKAAQEKETSRAKRENFLNALLPGKELSPYARDALVELVERAFPKPLQG